MARYYHRRWSGRDWAAYHVSQRQQLTNMFAGIDKDIETIFFNLNKTSLDALFLKYGKSYGDNAEKYARKTYAKWREGSTKLSGQTAQRLLNLIPPYLSKNIKYELIRKLREHYLPRHSEYITTTQERWKNDVIPIVNKFMESSTTFELPDILKEKTTWLSDGDVDTANRMLASLEQEEAQIRSNYLSLEFKRIEALVEHIDNTQTVCHTIKLPQGEIGITIEQEKKSFVQSIFGVRKMKKTANELVLREDIKTALAKQQKRGSLLNLTLDDLSEEQKKQLTKKVINERMRLDVSQAEADQRFGNSTRDMANTIRAVNSLEQSSKSDYDVKSTFETASGSTDIHVKKNNNTVIIVVAVVIGIIILMLMR